MKLLLRLGSRVSARSMIPNLPQLARTRALTISHSTYYARKVPHRAATLNKFRQQESIASISHTEEIDYDALLEEKLMQNAEALENVTDEQLAYWDSEGFGKLLSEYPAIALNIRVPPGAPVAEVDDEMAADLAIELYVAGYPAELMQSPDAQERFAEMMTKLIEESIPVIKEGLRIGWLAPVDKKVAAVLDSA
ncbi:uncharacterized protein LAJ45_05814 [Morchella importuna]|uniref:uncharacterized protein n=1 Tax=Morchella importuna TaxID=1174673 RepID=UPI001E8E46CA|nr:uncharacterized protein LAJ45_05814 [Morchella importuna]KAH8150128.1 hypothetical protein LAJ45_05814 [Morchella importuna]